MPRLPTLARLLWLAYSESPAPRARSAFEQLCMLVEHGIRLAATSLIHLEQSRHLEQRRLAMRQALGRLRARWASVRPHKGRFWPCFEAKRAAPTLGGTRSRRSMASLLAPFERHASDSAFGSDSLRHQQRASHQRRGCSRVVSNGIHHSSRQRRRGSHQSATHDRDVSPTPALAHRDGVARPARNRRFTEFAPRYLSPPAPVIARAE